MTMQRTGAVLVSLVASVAALSMAGWAWGAPPRAPRSADSAKPDISQPGTCVSGPEPPANGGGPVVMALVLREVEGSPQAKQDPVEPWVKDEMRKLGAKDLRTERPWFALTEQAAILCDTKLHGTLTMRLLPASNAETLTIIFDGSEAGRLDLPRKDGATRLALRVLDSGLAAQKFYLAFRVDRAASQWPRPLVIGPESNGKEVVVKGTKDVLIGLPGDRRSGRAWVVAHVHGDSITSASVTPVGEPQFTPAIGTQSGADRCGIFENLLRVTRPGKSYVELDYKRPWQTDKAPEKTFKVTLDVQP